MKAQPHQEVVSGTVWLVSAEICVVPSAVARKTRSLIPELLVKVPRFGEDANASVAAIGIPPMKA